MMKVTMTTEVATMASQIMMMSGPPWRIISMIDVLPPSGSAARAEEAAKRPASRSARTGMER